jgi:hypothetical protein
VKPLAKNSVYTVAEGKNANDKKKKDKKRTGRNFYEPDRNQQI